MSRRRPRIKLKTFYKWHRYFGINAALVIIVISVTGIALNHTEDLQLNKQSVNSPWLLNWYGIGVPSDQRGFKVGSIWLVEWNGRLLSQELDLGNQHDTLLGAVIYQDLLVVALTDSLKLMSAEGELIETLRSYQGLPDGLQAIGLTENKQLAVQTDHGTYVSDEDVLSWQKQSVQDAHWSQPTALPKTIYQQMLTLYQGNELNIERVILDLHSGRLMSQGGVYFFDFIALAMIFLSSSGLWVWVIRKLKARGYLGFRHD